MCGGADSLTQTLRRFIPEALSQRFFCHSPSPLVLLTAVFSLAAISFPAVFTVSVAEAAPDLFTAASPVFQSACSLPAEPVPSAYLQHLLLAFHFNGNSLTWC